jgi:hypothetical protein
MESEDKSDYLAGARSIIMLGTRRDYHFYGVRDRSEIREEYYQLLGKKNKIAPIK